MVKKAIDARIPALIRNGAQTKQRSFFVVVGDRQKDVIVNLYHVLQHADLRLNKHVLWAYKSKLLGFTSHRAKREKKIRREIKRGTREADSQDPFELFVSTQRIEYVYYRDTHRILGRTYGMCILQDFEALTPNLLARTIETVEGGGLVILLLKGMHSLKQLYSLSMDVHSRYRTEAHADVVARFNERFILSLGSCGTCLVVDDELNVLPISGGRNVQQLGPPDPDAGSTSRSPELDKIKHDLEDTQPVGPLVALTKTTDQARALLTFADAISEKTLRRTVALTAARGRGKSAALGLAIAAAIAHGYGNIFITSPSPENLKTLFEFVFKGFDALGYVDHADYDIIQSTNPDFNKAIVRVNVRRQHRQIIQYIQPQDSFALAQAELLVIDEAAAVPLPLVRKLMGPYLVFLASTINGYEGTGRSLSLKLVSQLREQSRGGGAKHQSNGDIAEESSGSTVGRSLREITLAEPIRYAAGDPVEAWLNKLLCLDATLPAPKRGALAAGGAPHPSACELLAVNRDTLFSFHPVSEQFLHAMVSLYVASHYKNSPNDLQLMSDAPAHYLYVLVPPVPPDTSRLPEPLCVIQVALEGRISRASVQQSLARGQRAGGDLIPWLVSQQFQDEDFAGLSGARIVRIATNPDYIGMGYGARALELLLDFYAGKFRNLSETTDELPALPEMPRVTDEDIEASTLQSDTVRVRDIHAMPPLFARLHEIAPPAGRSMLDYVGVSYGLTQPLHKFWKRAGFAPVYLRQTQNELTGEHTCVMLRLVSEAAAPSSSESWLSAFANDFHRRFVSLLSFQFRSFPAVLALSIDESAGKAFRVNHRLSSVNGNGVAEPGLEDQDDAGAEYVGDSLPGSSNVLTKAQLDRYFTPHDLRRLDSYAANMLDYHVILDLLPYIASLYFCGNLRNSIQLSGVQAALLLAIGCQRREIDDVARELGMHGSAQLLAMFVKLMRKCSLAFRRVLEGAAAHDLPDEDAGALPGDNEDAREDNSDDAGDNDNVRVKRRFIPLDQTVEEELEPEVSSVKAAERERMRSMIDALPLSRYEINAGSGTDWAEAERSVARGAGAQTVTVRHPLSNEAAAAKKRKAGSAVDEALKEERGAKAKSARKSSKGSKGSKGR